MIEARFGSRNGSLVSVTVSGHAEYAQSGEDVICASVSSALMLTCNGITEVLGVPARVLQEENRVTLILPEQNLNNPASQFLQALLLHLGELSKDYSKNLTTTVSEV